jgi:hypothetical protein
LSDQKLRKGQDWRLGWRPEAEGFCGLVGGNTWAIELTCDEFTEFCHLFTQLIETMATMASELMDEEAIAIDLQTERIWMLAQGYPQDYAIRFVLLTGRRGEGEWSGGAIAELGEAIQRIHVF